MSNKVGKESLTQSELKKILYYNSETGIFTWKINKGSRAKIEDKLTYKTCYGYIAVNLNGYLYQVSRLAWLYMTGSFPKGQIDHINGIRDDNRFKNLRDVNAKENRKNMRIRDNNTSGHIGVSFRKDTKKWTAYIFDNKKINLGSFNNKFEAICARKSAEVKYNFHCNHGRLI